MHWCFEYHLKFGNVERIEKRNPTNDECINSSTYNPIHRLGKPPKVSSTFIRSTSLWRNVGVSSERWSFHGHPLYFLHELTAKELLIFYIFNT